MSTLTYEEAHPMTSESGAAAGEPATVRRIFPIVKFGALIVTILGAIPTAITAYHAYKFGVPFSQVSERLQQYDLLVRNLDCKIDYQPLSTAQGITIDAGACPKSGDISLKISSKDGKFAYQWIAYKDLHKPGEPPNSENILDLLFSVAHAEGRPQSVRTAQTSFAVVCQTLISPQKLIRIVKEGDKCFRETTSPIRGTVDKREEVPCDTQCPAKG